MRNLQKLFRPTQTRERVIDILVLGLFYIVLFKPMFDVSGPVTAALVTIPVAAAGWLFGPRAGLIAGGVSIFVNAALFFIAEGIPGLTLFTAGWPGNLMVIAAGYSVGLLKKEVAKRSKMSIELNFSKRFITLISIATRNILDPKTPDQKYYYLANHLANLFVADYAYILSWDSVQKKMELLTSTRPVEKPFTDIVLTSGPPVTDLFVLTGRQALVINPRLGPPYIVDFSTITELKISVDSELAVPLIAGEYRFGVVIYGFGSNHLFSGEDLIYAQLVASQIALALWTAEQNEKIKRQLAEANSLAKITHALSETERIGIETVLQYIVESARELIPAAEHITLHMIDEERQLLIPRAITGQKDRSSKQLNIRVGQGIAGHVALTKQALNIPDVQDEPLFYSSTERPLTYRSLTVAPIQSNDRCVGTISADSQQANAFQANDCRLLEMLGTQAAIAIDNASLIEKTREDLREINSLYEITRGLAATLDPDQLMREITELLQNNFGYYHVQVFVSEPENGYMIMRHASGENAEILLAQGYRLAIGDGIVGHVAEVGESFATNHVEDVVFFKRNPLLPRTQSELCVPIKINNQVLGVLDIHEVPPRIFTDRQIKLMTAIADQLAVALQKAELYSDLQKLLRKEKETRAQLIQIEQLSVIGRLLASVSHELNNPLQAIQNALFLIKGDANLSEQSRQDLDIILSETERMSLLIGRLRATYRTSQSEDYKETILNVIVEDIYALTSTFMRHKSIIFNFQPDPALPQIYAIPDQIRQVILNLFMNAIDAMPRGGQLTVTTQYIPDDEQILVKVSDTGLGIEESILPNIFNAFITNKESGTGLGLTISHEIIQKHDGRILAENNPERGAVFSIWLPVSPKRKGKK
ncbi:MAG: GAF domain-containing protein [Anaerolineae bacterium]|nr:GAF domain-containing protein [Anaerolineae bacterium]